MSREAPGKKSNRSVKSLKLFAQRTLRGSKQFSSSSNPSIKLTASNPRFKRSSRNNIENHKTLRSVKMSSVGTPRSKSDDKIDGTSLHVKTSLPADHQVEMVLHAKKKAVRKQGEFLYGPSVNMRAHHAQKTKTQTRMFRKLLPAFSSATKNLRATRKKKVGEAETIEPENQEVKKTSTKTEEENNLIVRALRKLVLFSKLSDLTIERLAEEMEEKIIPAGCVFCKQGTFGDEMYVVKEGTLEGYREIEDSMTQEEIDEAHKTKRIMFERGSAFGELGMHFGNPREVSIEATSDCKLFSLTRKVFGGIVEKEYLDMNDQLLKALSKVKILHELTQDQVSRLVDENLVQLVSFTKGTNIIEKGSLGGTFYMIVEGTVECVVFEEKSGENDPLTHGRTSVQKMESDLFGETQSILVLEEETENMDKTMKKKKIIRKNYKLGPGLYFGERALVQNDFIRKADVNAITDVELLAITYDTFSKHLSGITGAFEENIRRQVLEDAPIFNTLTGDEIIQLQQALLTENFKHGDCIIRENKPNDKFYMVRKGEVEVRKSLESKSTDGVAVGTLKTEGYFGEGSLLFDTKANASVIARGDVSCFVLTKENFKKFMKEEKLAQLQETFNERQRRNIEKSKEVKNELFAGVTLKDVQTITTLGSGCFGLVKLVKLKDLESFYALKILEKGTVRRNNQELNVINEKNMLLECDHPFIVKLYKTFKDKKYLYFMMEFIQGGEMFQFLHHERSGYLDNKTARFFVACVVDALDFMHTRKIAYRDLKPENLMIDLDGYAKMVDFGFAKKLQFKTFTLCGTAQYLAPEILFNKGYNRSVDFWTLGILIYELFTGTTPFKKRDRNELFKAIKHENRIKFNRRWKGADHAKQIVCLLLHKHSKKRLGCATEHRGFKQVKQHAWFDPIDFEKLLYKEITPPWIPKVKNPGDFSHFEDYDEEDNPLKGKYDERAGESKAWKDF